MKNFKKKVCLVLALTFALTSFAACGNNDTTSSNGKVELRWMMAGSQQKDSELVWKKFNEELKKREDFKNYNLEFTLIPFADFAQKFLLFQTSGEKMDIVSTYNLDFGSEVKNGSLLDLTDMMEEYAPDILKEIPDWALKLCTVDNKQYAITNYQQMAAAKHAVVLQADEAERYFDFDAFKKAQGSSDTLNQEMYDIFENYLTTLKSNGELHLGMYPGTSWAILKGYDSIESYRWVFKRAGDDVKVEHFMETDAYKLVIENADKFFKKGFIRKDVLSAELNTGIGKADGYDIWHVQCVKDSEPYYTQVYNMDVNIIEPYSGFYLSNTATAGGNAILASSKYPKEALKFLNMMYTEQGKDLYRLLVFGIEGQHYTMVEGSDVRINPIGYSGHPGAADAPYGLYKWIVGNCALAYESPNEAEGWIDYVFNDWNVNSIPSKLPGFILDKTAFDVEASQIATITNEYLDQIASGSLADYKATYAEAMNKLEIAGMSMVKAEIQKQVDKFLASQK